LLAYLPGVERVSSHTVGFVGEDITEISRFLSVALGYSVDLQP
jgi:D-aminopeptidase